MYGYDSLNRLTSVNYGDGETQSYAFDAMGNRASKSDTITTPSTSTTTTGYTYDAANRLTARGTASYTSDANGNTLTDADGRTNTWDSENRLVKCVKSGGSTDKFTYGADGLRRSKRWQQTPHDFATHVPDPRTCQR